MLNNSFNLRNRYRYVKCIGVKYIVMSVETSTIGFICNSLRLLNIVLLRQCHVRCYYIDLYIPGC